MKSLFTIALSLLAVGSLHAEMAEFEQVATNAQMSLQKVGKKITVTLTNPNNQEYTDAPVCIALPKGCQYKSATVKTKAGVEIPCQMDDLDGDGTMDELAFVHTMVAGAKEKVTIVLSKEEADPKRYAERVYTMFAVRDKTKGIPYFDHKHQWCDTVSEVVDTHYSDVFPHGPAMENELIGLRLFFNAKQSTDYYGKRIKQLEFADNWWYSIEIPELRDQHRWGEDVIRVGETVSVGTLRGWNREKDDAAYASSKPGTIDPCMQNIAPFKWRQYRVVTHGPLRTVVDLNVEGWEYQGRTLNVKSRYILYAGQREVEVIQQFQGDTKDIEFVTGAMKVGCLNTDSVDIALLRYEADGRGLLATYGKDWPDGNRNLFPVMRHCGLAVRVPEQYVTSTIDRREQILYGLRTDAENAIHYRFAMCAPDLETFAPTADGRWTPDTWFEWTKGWNELKPIVVK